MKTISNKIILNERESKCQEGIVKDKDKMAGGMENLGAVDISSLRGEKPFLMFCRDPKAISARKIFI
jgi:hypothetical protein